MSPINLDPNLERPDDFYEALIGAHDGLDEAESQALNARLVLILANHIGAQDVLLSALKAAREPGRKA
ncbi:MAG: DUF2783 domain-containing protein [Minwuia sp.]|uniref:DUF2783 domain-containing protein n=1 Tax=Minwuia sp. TaxID=2493630 RepID=UPI003A870AAD